MKIKKNNKINNNKNKYNNKNNCFQTWFASFKKIIIII